MVRAFKGRRKPRAKALFGKKLYLEKLGLPELAMMEG